MAATIISEMTHAILIVGLQKSESSVLSSLEICLADMYMRAALFVIWVWYKHVRTSGRIIKGTNYRQTNEFCTLFSVFSDKCVG